MALTKISRSLLDTGISDSSDATAITITSDEKIGIGTASPAAKVELNGDGELLRLDGTGGAARSIRFRGLSTGTPAFITIDGSFKLHCEDSGTHMEFHTADTERMRIASTGNVGIGTSSPAAPLHIERASSETNLIVRSNVGGSGSNIGGRLRLQLGAQSNSGSGNADTQAGDTLGQIMFEGQGTDYSYQGGNIICKVQTGDGDDNRSNQGTFMSFETLNVGSVSPAERMRINQSGALLVGKTVDNLTDAGFTLKKRDASDHAQLTCVGAGSTSVETYYIYDNANSEFEFFVSYAGAVYYRSLVSLSDERKKDNIADITFGLDAVKELRPVSFDWKNNKGNDQLGFIAQEVETTSLKQLVSTYKDENIEDCKSLNKEQMIPVLVKAIQELSAKVEELESKINE